MEWDNPLKAMQAFGTPYLSEDELMEYLDWWRQEGWKLSHAVDRAGTPWVRMYDEVGHRIDRLEMGGGYEKLLRSGYQSGVIERVFVAESIRPFFEIGYITSFFDPGLYCPYTVTLATALMVEKYAPPEIKDRFLPRLQDRMQPWQGATWMTEVRGGSDLGGGVQTIARRDGDQWRLNGEKYFASNAGAELAIVAARPEGAPSGIRGLALFLVPRFRSDGSLNYFIRRLKDKIGTRSVPTGEVIFENSEAWQLGEDYRGIYLILESLNLSRVANSIAAVAWMQRMLADVLEFGQQRIAFGKPLLAHPMYRAEVTEWQQIWQKVARLVWLCVDVFNEVWREMPPYSERYLVYRLLTHLAKAWSAEVCVQAARWVMEAFGGNGVIAEHGVDRFYREAIVLAIWEGTRHRHIIDAMEVIQRKQGLTLLRNYLHDVKGIDLPKDLLVKIMQWTDRDPNEVGHEVEPLLFQLAEAIGNG